MRKHCWQPQAHPDRCGCPPPVPIGIPAFEGIKVIELKDLPPNTMMVSPDVYRTLKGVSR